MKNVISSVTAYNFYCGGMGIVKDLLIVNLLISS